MAATVSRYHTTAGYQYHNPPNPRLAMPELIIRIRGLRPSTTTYDIWKCFSPHGEIVWIELFEDQYGKRDGNAVARFLPPPKDEFWANCEYLFTPADGTRSYRVWTLIDHSSKNTVRIESPLGKTVVYNGRMNLSPVTLDFGVMLHPTSMMIMQTILGDDLSRMSLLFDFRRNRIITTFEVPFKDPRNDGMTDFESTSSVGQYDRSSRYMFQIPFSDVKKIGQVEVNDSTFSLIICLDSPPEFLRRKKDLKATHSPESRTWSDLACWLRQTDIVYDPPRLKTTPISLQKQAPVIDIGRWTTYRLVLHRSPHDDIAYPAIKKALQDFDIEIVPFDKLEIVTSHPAPLWPLINPPEPEHTTKELQSLDKGNGSYVLPFEVRYQLEACISWDILNEYNISPLFLNNLAEVASKDSFKARTILEYIMEQDGRIYDPLRVFEDQEALEYSPKTDIPHYCAYSRKATVTPTRIHFDSPTVEATNRVLRHYATEHKDGRFLRVQFTDEMSRGRINSCTLTGKNDELFTRIHRTLVNGIQVGGRLYKFLAFGNSQFRENGAYFFCPTDHLSCDDIRQWMGNFSHINVVAKYSARLGQCFSSTRAIHGLLRPNIVKIPDIERGGRCFTDGVGKISPFLAQMIGAELSLHAENMLPPSAFQFRLGGCKGILVVSPDAKNRELHIRKSQEKFTAIYNGLEIIRCSRYCCATLNRQTITILSSLGVADKVFHKMLSEQLSNYENAMDNNKLAGKLLTRYVDENRMTINIASMILDGFMAEEEPFVMSLLHLWRAWSIKLLKEKARVIVEKGAFVFGCVDETATLKGYNELNPGEVLCREGLPQIFIQVPDKTTPGRYTVIKGICVVGRNPSLHPGDLRVVEAVDVPALHHLRDVVVFPQTGDRDIPGMCSGGDLDGDDYFVIWDEELLPQSRRWNCEPMNYTAPQPISLRRPVAVGDLMKFFVKFMKNDTLPTIAHAHVAQSDYLEDGVRNPKCLELAALHSKAVDYFKTGQPAEMPKGLQASKWPHFMEKQYKPKHTIYRSHKVLGQLYDRVEKLPFLPKWQNPFDKRILDAYELDNRTLEAARQIKRKYDIAMRRIMAQQEIGTEFEVWSTFVLSKPRVGTEYKLQEVVAGISGSLKDRFRQVCIEKAGGKDFPTLGPFVAAMYRVTKEEVDLALAECPSASNFGVWEVPRRKRMEPEFMPLISFPWLFDKELGQIATRADSKDSLHDFGLTSLKEKQNTSGSRHQQGQSSETDDFIQQDDGVVIHHGEELALFPEESDPFPDEDYVLITDKQDENSGITAESASATNSPIADHRDAAKNSSDVHVQTLEEEEDNILDDDMIVTENLQVGESLLEKLARLNSS